MFMSTFTLGKDKWKFIENFVTRIFLFLWIELGESLKKVCSFMIRAYQCTLSPYFCGRCRFYPSCSEYAQQAFCQKSFGEALFLSLRRFLKCQPFYFNSSIWDPLPTKDDQKVCRVEQEKIKS